MPGEIADMMLEGTMCCQCGEWLHEGEDGDGYPMMCESCAADEKAEEIISKNNAAVTGVLIIPKAAHDYLMKPVPKIWGCSDCKKLFRRKNHATDHCKTTGHREPIDTTKVKA